MDLYENHLEVKLEFINGKFRATCSGFPKCRGIGETQAEALDKLSGSIGRFVGKTTKESLGKIFQGDNYTNLLLDGNADQKTQRRFFSVGDGVQMQKGIYLRLKPFPASSADKEPVPLDVGNEIDMDTFSEFQIQEVSDGPESPMEQLVGLVEQLMHKNSQEGFMFGFPLSFN